MMIGRAVAALVLVAALSACADDAPPPSPFGTGQTFTYNANQWSVSDRRDLNELQISAVSALSSGMGSAGVYQYQSDNLPRPVFAEAVRGWFLTSGRHCSIADGSQAAPNTYVFRYNCWYPTYRPG